MKFGGRVEWEAGWHRRRNKKSHIKKTQSHTTQNNKAMVRSISRFLKTITVIAGVITSSQKKRYIRKIKQKKGKIIDSF